MTKPFAILLTVSAIIVPSAALAGHSELTVPPADTFQLGGDQVAPMAVSGRNVGQTVVVILSRRGSNETPVANVQPDQTFSHVFKVGETALIRNGSPTLSARMSVDFTGSASDLSMRYSLPPRR